MIDVILPPGTAPAPGAFDPFADTLAKGLAVHIAPDGSTTRGPGGAK